MTVTGTEVLVVAASLSLHVRKSSASLGFARAELGSNGAQWQWQQYQAAGMLLYSILSRFSRN